MTNMELRNGFPAVRRGVRQHSLAGSPLQTLPFQGMKFYNPAKGLSQRTFANDESSLIISAGGERFRVSPDAAATSSAQIGVFKIGEQQGDTEALLAWIYQAENYVIVQDGESDTWIWPGFGEPTTSLGYNSDDKEASELPNGATAGGEAHGRIVTVVNGSQVIIGDIIHKSNRSNASNILKTTEQTYWETGSFMSPPSNMGGVNAIEVLPQQNSIHGEGDVMVHCKDGVFAININVAPRSSWASIPLTRNALRGTAARGPYGIAVSDGDQYFRSKHGVQTLRSAAAESQRLGNPLAPISEPVKDWLLSDPQNFLRYCSLIKWDHRRRIYCSTGLWVRDGYRGARGVVSLNLTTVAQSRVAWEGLHTLPPEIGDVVQMENGEFNDVDRTFAFCTKKVDGAYENSIIEYTDEDHDILADGTRVPISAQAISGEVYGQVSTPFTEKEFEKGTIYFKKVRGTLKWGVWCRDDDDHPWVYWRGGTARPGDPESDLPGEQDDGSTRALRLAETASRPVRRRLDLVPEPYRNGRKIQILVRVRGVCQIEGVKLGYFITDQQEQPCDAGNDPAETASAQQKEEQADDVRKEIPYSDYEYTDTVRWEDDERIN